MLSETSMTETKAKRLKQELVDRYGADKDFNNYKKNKEKMITIEVNKEDLVNLITGISPSFDLINPFTEMGIGNYIGGHVDRWNWNRSTLENLDEHELLEIYNRMRK